MKIVLAVILSFLFIGASAQCTYTWEHFTTGTKTKKKTIETLISAENIKGPDGFEIPKKVLDSVIQILKDPYWYLPRILSAERMKKLNDSERKAIIDTFLKLCSPNFLIFKYGGREIAHSDIRRYAVGDTIDVHEFSYCQTEWNDDFLQNEVLYTSRFGIVKKDRAQGMDAPALHYPGYFIYRNSCLTDAENKRLRQLILKIRQGNK